MSLVVGQIINTEAFFLNHRTFMASRKPERVGKSPTELMTGKKRFRVDYLTYN